MQGYVRLTPGPGFEPLRAALYFGQRLVTRPRLRRGIARCIAGAINLSHPPKPVGRIAGNPERASQPGGTAALPSSTADDQEAILAVLRERGLAMLPPLLPPPLLDELTAWLRNHPVLGPDGRPAGLASLPPGTATASYPLETVLACPHVLDLVNHPDVLAMAEDYLGCRPTVSSLGVRWSFPQPDRPADVQCLHRDPDDWRFLKLFVYLTDVDAGTGPHLFVSGSHRTAGRLRAALYGQEAVERRYGADAVLPVTGAAGTCFLADTWGIHAGAVPRTGPRLLLQVQYSVLPVYAFRYRPVPMRQHRAVDPYVNRLILAGPQTP